MRSSSMSARARKPTPPPAAGSDPPPPPPHYKISDRYQTGLHHSYLLGALAPITRPSVICIFVICVRRRFLPAFVSVISSIVFFSPRGLCVPCCCTMVSRGCSSFVSNLPPTQTLWSPADDFVYACSGGCSGGTRRRIRLTVQSFRRSRRIPPQSSEAVSWGLMSGSCDESSFS